MIDLGLTQEELREEILNRAAAKLADDAGTSEYIGDRVQRLIGERIDAAMSASVTSKIDALLDAQLERMLTATIQPVDIYGDKVGEPTTIRDILSDRAKEFWNALVDTNGAAVKDPGYYGRDRYKTRAEWMLGKIVSDKFADEVKQNATNILGALKEKLRADGLASLNKHLDEIIKVKTK